MGKDGGRIGASHVRMDVHSMLRSKVVLRGRNRWLGVRFRKPIHRAHFQIDRATNLDLGNQHRRKVSKSAKRASLWSTWNLELLTHAG